jgi:alanyl-tRNA synthetase
LDITHYKSMSREEELEVENMANRLIADCVEIDKSFMDKMEAEIKYGFSLYQGGVVPGNELRVVNIAGVDTEACCGTHADNTAEVGWIKIIKSQRISDGIVRLYYVARERAIEVLNNETQILTNLCKTWGVDQNQIDQTANRFFHEYKRLTTVTKKQDMQILTLQVKFLLKDDSQHPYFVKSDQADPTLYVSSLPQFAQDFKDKGKGIVYIADNYVVGLFGNPAQLNVKELEEACKSMSSKPVKVVCKDKVSFKFKEKGRKAVDASGVLQIMITGADMNVDKLAELLTVQKFVEME